jgi:membrane fusion protein, copper/silver efflux system
MKIKYFILFISIVSALAVSSCKQKKDGSDSLKGKIYTCSMHPQILRSEPGNCPICGMKLVEKKDVMEGKADSTLNDVVSPTYQKILSQVKTTKPVYDEFPVVIKVNGTITYDTRYINNISARVSGRIEKNYIKYKFQAVTKGQKLFEIYSPDLLTAQQNLIFLLENDSSETELIQSAREKLILLGMNNDEIKDVEKTEKPKYQITVYSDYSGYIVNKDYINSDDKSESTNSSMSGATTKAGTSDDLTIKEGMYLNQGETVFKVVNNSSVWALLKIYNSDYPYLKTGQKTEIYTDNKETPSFTGTLNYLETFNTGNDKSVNARVYMDNSSKKYKIGQLITASVYGENQKGIWVPKGSVLDLGKRKIVIIKTKDTFGTKEVTTGTTYNDWIEIKTGLDTTNVIASNAQYLIDSESFIK